MSKSFVSEQDVWNMGFDDGSDMAHQHMEAGEDPVQPSVGWHEWLLAEIGRKGLCAIMEEDEAENMSEWTPAMSRKLSEYDEGAKEGFLHVVKVIYGNHTAGS